MPFVVGAAVVLGSGGNGVDEDAEDGNDEEEDGAFSHGAGAFGPSAGGLVALGGGEHCVLPVFLGAGRGTAWCGVEVVQQVRHVGEVGADALDASVDVAHHEFSVRESPGFSGVYFG